MTNFAREWLAKREQLEEAATEGPWFQDSDDPGLVWGEQRSDGDGHWSLFASETGHDATAQPQDAEFIADARTELPAALAALKAVLEFATDERNKISRTYISQPDTAYAGYANAMDDVIRTIEAALRGES